VVSRTATLYAFLRGADLRVGVTERLRIEAVLARAEIDDEVRLRRVLAAVVVKSKEELPRFDRAFDDWWSSNQPTRLELPDAPPPEVADAPAPRGWLAALLLVVVGAALAVLFQAPDGVIETPPDARITDAGPPDGGVADAGELAERFLAPTFELRAAPAEVERGPELVLALLALLSLGFTVIAFRARRPEGDESPKRDPDAPLPAPLPPTPDLQPVPRFVTQRAEGAMVWGIGQFVSDETTHRLDLPASIEATIAAGGVPTPRMQRARHHREVWLWIDDTATRRYPEMQRFADEAAAALERAGLAVEVAHFSGVPAFLRGRDGRFSPSEVDERRDAARVAVLTDGRTLANRLAHGRTGPLTRRLLRHLAAWPGLAFADFGRGAHGLGRTLGTYALEEVAPEGLAAWLGGETRYEPASVADVRAWAAACALSSAPVDAETALQLRDALAERGLSASVWALSRLPGARSAPGGRLRWDPSDEVALLAHLQRMESGPGSLFEAALAFWRARFEVEAAGQRAHRETQRALLDLWRGPGRDLDAAARTLREHREAMAEGTRWRLGRLLPAGLPARDGPPAIELPWRWEALSADTQEDLREAGFAALVADVSPQTLRRGARIYAAAGLAVAVAVGALAMAWMTPEQAATGAPTYAGEPPGDWLWSVASRGGSPESWAVAAGPPRAAWTASLVEPGQRVHRTGEVEPDCRGWTPGGTSWRCGYDPDPPRPRAAEWPARSVYLIDGRHPEADALAARLLDTGAADVVEIQEAGGAHDPDIEPLLSVDQVVVLGGPGGEADLPRWRAQIRDRMLVSGAKPARLAWVPYTPADALSGREVRPIAEVWPAAEVLAGSPVALGRAGPWCPERCEDFDGITYCRVCAGPFTMGSADNDPEAYPDEHPAHEVTLSSFWIGRTEVSNEQYRKELPKHAPDKAAGWPVTDVTWHEAKAFCKAKGARLPTEAEWEYAARGKDGRRYPWGDEDPDASRAVFGQGGGVNPEPVGGRASARGPFGTLDQAGNVWEWVADCYAKRYEPGAVTNPLVDREDCGRRVLRGGSFFVVARLLRSAVRSRDGPETRDRIVGFRCVRVARREQ